jgi:hypothetical protein
MRITVRRSLAVALGCISAATAVGALTAQRAAADQCGSVARNGICLGGPGTTVGGQTVGPFSAGGQSVPLPNPVPVEVCYFIGCLEPGQNITTVTVPQETVSATALPSQTVPAYVETAPIFAVAVIDPSLQCMSTGVNVQFYSLPVFASGSVLSVNWGDGSSNTYTMTSQGMNGYHYYQPGVFVMSISLNGNPPVFETVTNEEGVCAGA